MVNSAVIKWTAIRHFMHCVLRPWLLHSIFSQFWPLSPLFHYHFSSCFDRWGCSCKGIQQKYRNATFASLSRTGQPSLSSLQQAGKTCALWLPLGRAPWQMTTAQLFCSQGGNPCAVSRSPALSAQGQLSTPTPCVSVLQYFRLQPAQTCHSKRDCDCICTYNWFKHGFVWSLNKDKFYYYIIAQRI